MKYLCLAYYDEKKCHPLALSTKEDNGTGQTLEIFKKTK